MTFSLFVQPTFFTCRFALRPLSLFQIIVPLEFFTQLPSASRCLSFSPPLEEEDPDEQNPAFAETALSVLPLLV